MWFKFAKLFFVVNTSVQAPTSLIVSNARSESNYTITKNMIKAVKYNDFNDWATIPWNSAYFDVGQPDLKLVAAFVHKTVVSPYSIWFKSDVVGSFNRQISGLSTDYNFTEQDLEQLSLILFNHNFIQSSQLNDLIFWNGRCNNLSFKLTFEITKPLSFYIQGFMFYLSADYFKYFSSIYTFSFLDYEGNIRYNFKGVLNNKDSVYNLGKYNFITMPVHVPNLKNLTINFDLTSLTDYSDNLHVNFGQMNIFSSKDIVPAPPNSPFNPEYERPSWYDVFGHLRNAFRWVLYGVVGKVLPVEPLRTCLESFRE
ncbi:hypothetical protein [Spiroplasma endosymbiont of Notiophilus biguttatus]|uniref:hypothetical protein n=1 Tax=Spiroplasma endosymbiont of Notiophilus biguttatus TaxID=3066285 RepID=UPI00313CA62D